MKTSFSILQSDAGRRELLRKIPARMLREELMRRVLQSCNIEEIENELGSRRCLLAKTEAEQLKAMRASHWATCKAAAVDMGISLQTLSWAESGKRPATTFRVLALARKKIGEIT